MTSTPYRIEYAYPSKEYERREIALSDAARLLRTAASNLALELRRAAYDYNTQADLRIQLATIHGADNHLRTRQKYLIDWSA